MSSPTTKPTWMTPPAGSHFVSLCDTKCECVCISGGDHISLRRNVVYDNHQSWGGVAPRRMRFEGNFWDDDQLLFYGPTGQLRIRGNTLLGGPDPGRRCERIPACGEILGAAGLEPRWRQALRPPAPR